jgi:hypothetical protein
LGGQERETDVLLSLMILSLALPICLLFLQLLALAMPETIFHSKPNFQNHGLDSDMMDKIENKYVGLGLLHMVLSLPFQPSNISTALGLWLLQSLLLPHWLCFKGSLVVPMFISLNEFIIFTKIFMERKCEPIIRYSLDLSWQPESLVTSPF